MSGGLCTTWRVGSDNHMMTNNHCISTQSATQASEVWFNYQNTTCGSTTPAPVTKVTGAQMLKTDGPLDYTLYTVNNFAAIASFGNYGLDVCPAIKDEQISIPQHGAGNPKELAITSKKVVALHHLGGCPNGTVYSLHNRSGGSADNIVKTYQINVGSADSLGTWKLRVVDAASSDIGKLNNWKITFTN